MIKVILKTNLMVFNVSNVVFDLNWMDVTFIIVSRRSVRKQ